MREILFKGKRTDGGGWIEGCIVYNPDNMEPVGIIQKEDVAHPLDIPYMYDGCVDGHMPNVDGKTVGQYIGLKDRNGVRIFSDRMGR